MRTYFGYVTNDDLMGDVGFWVTVDLEIPIEKQDYFRDYPPAPVRRSVSKTETSPHYNHLLSMLRC